MKVPLRAVSMQLSCSRTCVFGRDNSRSLFTLKRTCRRRCHRRDNKDDLMGWTFRTVMSLDARLLLPNLRRNEVRISRQIA
jgi:hypothetical protein